MSPGGVGFDISCGVRLLVSPHAQQSVHDRLPALMDDLDRRIPRGLGSDVWDRILELSIPRALKLVAIAGVQLLCSPT